MKRVPSFLGGCRKPPRNRNTTRALPKTERLILLCDRRKSSYIIVPKRAIDPAEIASLRDLLRRKLKPLA